MKFSIEAGKLKEIIEELVAIASSKKINTPVMSHLKVDVRDGKVIFFAANREVSMSKEFNACTPRPGMCTVPAKSLLDLLKAFGKEKTLTLSMIDDNRIRITQARSRFNLASMDPHSFPEVVIPDVEYMPMSSDAFLEAIDKVSPALADEKDVRESLQAALLEPTGEEGFMRAVAADGHKLITCKIPGILPRPVLVPRSSLTFIKKALLKSEEFGLFIEDGDSSLVFKLPDGFISTRLLVNKFPDYRNFLPRGSYLNVLTNTNEIIEAVRRVLLFTNKHSMTIGCEIKAKDKLLVIKSRSAEGDAEETVSIKEDSTVPADTNMNFNGKYLEQILSKFGTEEISMRIYGQVAPVVFLGKGSNMMSIIMPVNK